MKFILSAICFIFVMAHSTEILSAEKKDFLIKVGVMKPATPTKNRLWETNVLTMDPTRRPGFCFIVDPPNTTPYEIYSISYLPQKPQNLTGEFNHIEPSNAVDGIKTKTKHVGGIRPFCFDFHHGDPIGKYTIKVFNNKTLKTTLSLDVVPVESNPQNDQP